MMPKKGEAYHTGPRAYYSKSEALGHVLHYWSYQISVNSEWYVTNSYVTVPRRNPDLKFRGNPDFCRFLFFGSETDSNRRAIEF